MCFVLLWSPAPRAERDAGQIVLHQRCWRVLLEAHVLQQLAQMRCLLVSSPGLSQAGRLAASMMHERLHVDMCMAMGPFAREQPGDYGPLAPATEEESDLTAGG